MWCMRCDRHLSQCVCPDINERLKGATQGGRFAYKKCAICGNAIRDFISELYDETGKKHKCEKCGYIW